MAKLRQLEAGDDISKREVKSRGIDLHGMGST